MDRPKRVVMYAWVLQGVLTIRITGYGPATGHAEPGRAVAATLEEALEIGGHYQQDAIFTVEGDTLRVISCAPCSGWVALGSYGGPEHIHKLIEFEPVISEGKGCCPVMPQQP